MNKILLFLILLALCAVAAVGFRYGGGEPYPDVSTAPLLDEQMLESVLAYPEPIGNVAVNSDGRLFFTVHPESRPQGNRLLEYVNGASLPYPDIESQLELFDTPLGLVIDRNNLLWSIDHGNHGLRRARLTAIDLATGDTLLSHAFPEEIAPKGSFLQDLQVSHDGASVVIADASFWRKSPALIIYDVATGQSRRVLENDPSVSAENFRIRQGERELTFFGGLLTLRGGVDGIALGPKWLYFGALSGSSLYRIALADLRNEELPAAQLAGRVERVANKPLSDGFSIDADGMVYVTDVEHNAISIFGGDASQPATLVRSNRIRWPDALSFGPDGWLYIADSALPELILKPKDHIDAQGPYRIFRVNTGAEGFPGQ
ncbi:MAG: hypothetical protein HKN77_01360 [Woeseiaceae bacterium]|nr:hypothetical protein [Woeseiaceae bacterium]